MRVKRASVWLAAALLLLAVAGPAAAAKNIILMIGDGMGYNAVAATAMYDGVKAPFESFPVKYGVSTYSRGQAKGQGYDPARAWQEYAYVTENATDSAAAASALATGTKVADGVLNLNGDGQQLTTIVELAAASGRSAGVVTSVQLSHATPAGMYAHNADRDNYEQIANEMLGSRGQPPSKLDVIMGAGHPGHDANGAPREAGGKDYQYVGGPATWEALKNGSHPGKWRLIEEEAGLAALAKEASPPKVLGVARAAETLQYQRTPKTAGATPGADPKNAGVPTLAQMTTAALQVLGKNPRGFVVMIEGGAIDWAAHDNDLARLVEEQRDFNAAVQAAMDWVQAHSNWQETLLIVTADHETGHLWGPGSRDRGSFTALENRGPGRLPGHQFGSKEHTNALVPLYARGAGAERCAAYADEYDPRRGWYLDNTEVFRVMKAELAARREESRRRGRPGMRASYAPGPESGAAAR